MNDSSKPLIWSRAVQFFREVGRRHVLPVAAVYFVACWLLLQIAAIVLPSFAAPEWVMRALIIASVAGFPIALLLAWIYNITSGGLVRTSTQTTVSEQRHGSASTTRQPGSSSSSAELKSKLFRSSQKIVAVLPFVNRSPLEEDAFFADGVHDELLMHLAKLSAIQVISRTSVMRYRDTVQSVSSIAQELGASVILEGAVQRAGARVRVIVQLIDGTDDIHLWAENFDRELTTENLFDIQAEITRLIAKQLEVALSATDEATLSESAPTENLAAYDAYLQGQLLARSEAAGEQDFRRAIESFDTAIALDAKFAEPHAGKARAQLTLYWFYGWDKHWVELAHTSVASAKELNPNAIETLLAEAYYQYWGKLNYPLAEAALNRVLEKAPNNAEAWACKAYVIRRAGQFDESICALEISMRLNPMIIDTRMELAVTLATFGRFEEAHENMVRVYSLAPNSAFTAYYAGDIGHLEGNAESSWSGASIEVESYDFVYCYRRAYHSIHTRNEKHMMHSLEDWPVEFHRTDSFPVTFEIYQAIIMKVLNRVAEFTQHVGHIKELLGKLPDPYPGGWRPDAPYFPVTLPGLLGDLAEVKRLTSEYEATAAVDQMGRLNHYHAIATAFAYAGDNEAALNYLEKLFDVYGPTAYLPISIMPAYDDLRNKSKYLALQTVYEASLVETHRGDKIA